MSSGRRWSFKNLVGARRRRSCGCGTKSTDAIQPKPIFRTSASDRKTIRRHSPFSAATDSGGCASTSFSLVSDASPKLSPDNDRSAGIIAGGTKIDGSVVVAKDSDDPYRDFRLSMIQMILEKEIYSEDELQQLLHCFLELNSPRHHKVIVHAFVGVLDGGEMVVGGGGVALSSIAGT